jgi:DNA-binding XRE family transcriptional regulator
MDEIGPHIRFRQARERRGLSPDEVAERSGVSSPNVWDIETHEDELTTCYSPNDIRQFCRVLGIQPVELFGEKITEPIVSVDKLVVRIRDECRLRGVTLEEFEDVVGWRLSACIDPPEILLKDLTIDGLQWLCRELRIDWRRAL